MAQISYGTITITDTNDIESIIVEYARNQSTSSAPTSGWSTTRPTWAQGYYIWQRTRTHKAGTSADSDIYGTAVCITGSTGQTGGTGAAGRSLTNTITQYTTATNSATITQSNMGNYTWNSNVPSYSSSTPAYWVRVTNIYSNPSSTEYIIYKDNGLTDVVAKSVEANNNAAIANSIAQHANENAQGAMAQAAEAQYQTEALAAKVKHYWWDSTGAHIASGINGADVTEGTASTYGFNSLVGLASMTFGYNSYKTVELDGSIPALKFYKPSKTAQGDLTATLDSNGLVLSEGGVQAGTNGQSGFIYLSTKDYPKSLDLSINGHIPGDDDPAWREIIGTGFGVDANGGLYAMGARVSGALIVEVGSEESSNIFTKDDIITDYVSNTTFSVTTEGINLNIIATAENANAYASGIVSDAVGEINQSLTNLDEKYEAKDQAISEQFVATNLAISAKIDKVAETGDLISNINAVADQITLQASQINFGNNTVDSALIQTQTDINTLNAAISISTDPPSVRIGPQSSGTYVLIGSERLGFYQDGIEVAWIDADEEVEESQQQSQLTIDYGVLKSQLRIGQFLWKIRSTNRMSLRYSPIE